MNWVAWQMLTGDRAKYWGTIFGIAFGTLLISQQTALFIGLMRRTASQIDDVREATIWVMDPEVQNTDEILPLAETDVYRVRGVPGVSWAVRHYKGLARAKVSNGRFRQVMLMGLDETTMIGAPVEMVLGSLSDLGRPDGVIVDKAGFEYLWPGVEPRLGDTLEMNDRRAVIVGVCKAGAPFQTFPLIFTRYTRALEYAPPERNRLSFVLARPEAGRDVSEVCAAINRQTKLLALSRNQFFWRTIGYYLRSTGIPVNFGITIALGFIVGTAIAGQTFYLFTLENLRQFGALKAMGLGNGRLVLMILLQAGIVGGVGFGLGMGVTAFFFEATKNVTHLAGFYLQWQVLLGSAAAVSIIVVLASLVSIRRVLVLEPAIVFRGS
ncbi:MAG TPA: ABC transporter permease [Pirellulales bacterium]|jgi:putative ABC transport system permease protein